MGKSSKKKKATKKRKRQQDSGTSANQAHEVSKSPKDCRSDNGTKKQRLSSREKENIENASLSLASRLKRERGTADSTPLPPEWSKRHQSKKIFLTPDDGSLFESCKKECYRGFSWEKPSELPASLHTDFDEALDSLHDSGLFLYDAVQAGGKRVSHTFVTRTLVGKPGSTYRYLGLRLFSHPWSAVSKDGDEIKTSTQLNSLASLVDLGYSEACAKGLLQTGRVNHLLVERTKQTLEKEIAPHVDGGLVGSAEYSLTLINRMEPTSMKKDLKNETKHGLGKTSVSWHKDSGLSDFSSIAVYHTFRESVSTENPSSESPWRVGLRVASDSGSAPPALSIPLPSGSLYYLLDDFNHKHEHAVIAGSNHLRYSSTHRVAREGRGTWQYIRDKCKSMTEELLSSKNDVSVSSVNKRKLYLKKVRAQQQLLTEIEFEWLRQWGIQGKLHAELHPYWHKPMEFLMKCFEQLERSCVSTLSHLEQGKDATVLSDDLYDIVIEALEERLKLRRIWQERMKDPIYKSMAVHMQPIQIKVLDRKTHDSSKQLSENLEQVIANVRKWRVSFVSKGNIGKTAKAKANEKRSNLTKKEKRKVASNWEKLKLSMGKK